jgi:lysophospholipase L1-like esterase
MNRIVRRAASAFVLLGAFVAPATIATSAHAATIDNYVALGDSYSSGVGSNSYTLSSSCLRSVYAYPYLLSQQRPNTSLTFVACSGATTSDVLNTQIASVTASTNIVTISIGGNDLGFASLIANCVLADCNNALNATRTTADATLSPRLDSVYAAIKSHMAGGAKVVVLGYPHLFSTASCLGTTGITATERNNANLLSDEIDRVISQHAAAAGFTYKSAIASFTGHSVCSGSAWLNGLNIFNTTESFHPTRSGQSSGYLALVRQVVG